MTLLVSVVVGLLLSLSMAQVRTQRVLCGRTLADTLDLVCSGRGFHFHKRSADTAGPSKGNRVERSIRSGTGPVRSVVDECCRRPCTYNVLESYCAPADGNLVINEDVFIDYTIGPTRPTLSSTGMTTTESTEHYDPNSPSAEVFRGRVGHGQNGRKFRPYFYVQVGSRPTRNPLITE